MERIIVDTLLKKTSKQRTLVFEIDDKHFGCPILEINSIIRTHDVKILALADAPAFVKGVIELKKQFIPLVDLRLILKRQEINYTERTCIILVKILDGNISKYLGFIVDTVLKIHDIPIQDIAKLPIYDNQQNDEFVDKTYSLDDRIIFLLNIKKIINKKNLLNFCIKT